MEHTLWTEKYRPKKFEDVKGQTEIVKRVKAFVERKNMPHLLFAGPAGVGKSTLALVVARQLYGDDWTQNFLELNASVTPETPILIRKNKKIYRTNFENLSKFYFSNNSQKTVLCEDLEVLCLDKNYKAMFKKANKITRHGIDKIARIKYEGGSIRTSLNHSVFILDEEGLLKPKKVSELKKGDLLISFKQEINGTNNKVNLSDYYSSEFISLTSGLQENPTFYGNYDYLPLWEDSSWVLGLYTAEGCTSLKNNYTSGQVIFTVGYPQEYHKIEKLNSYFFNEHALFGNYFVSGSGFDRTRKSSMQFRINNTQFAKFFRDQFYRNNAQKNALSKKIPSFIFETSVNNRVSFLKGYSGDACGNWDEYLRYSSRSKELLIDTAWLGRISGIETSYHTTETRFIWKNKNFSYIRSELLPASILKNLVSKNKTKPIARNLLRHQLYGKKSKRVSKTLFLEISKNLKDSVDLEKIRNKLKFLSESSIYSVKITDIEEQPYSGFVYDFTISDGSNFFGGTTPVLLHNSDERGIDVVRIKVKDFARTKSIGNVPFKIIFLDECDALTREAQQALRRTMENYTTTTRFILSCNYSSKIIDPIQSRCTMFRFKPLEKEEMFKIVDKIAKDESLKIDNDTKEALYVVSNGDCRRMENILQSSSALSQTITSESIFSVASVAKPKEINECLNLAITGKFIDARNLLLDIMLKYGLSGEDLVKQIQSEIWNLNVSERDKVDLVDKCGEIEFRMTEGSDEFVQLEALLAQFTKCKK
jgi:replication factor C small subunit